MTPVRFACHGCGAAVDALAALPFRCPGAVAGDDIDHVLVPQDGAALVRRDDPNPFLRHRLLSPYRVARAAGLPDAAWDDIVGRLDDALVAVDGRGFRTTPMTVERALADAAGVRGTLWVKDETGNVSGSHKARHLMGVMLYLRVIEAARLAIASCGNAALAAAVVARAADWPLDVFIPPDADAVVVARLGELGARIAVCARRPGEAGDPCFLRFCEAVVAGAIPFGVQGNENGLAIEGGRTLAFEMAERFAAAGAVADAVYVQVGGRPDRTRPGARRRADGRVRAAGARLATLHRGGRRRRRTPPQPLHVAVGGHAGEPRARHSRRRDLRLARDRPRDALDRRAGDRRLRAGRRARPRARCTAHPDPRVGHRHRGLRRRAGGTTCRVRGGRALGRGALSGADPVCARAGCRYRPTPASTSAFRNRSTTSMNAIDGTSSSKAVIDAIW